MKTTGPQVTVHGGLSNNQPKAPSGYGVKGGASVNTPDRTSTAPTPKTIGGRDNG